MASIRLSDLYDRAGQIRSDLLPAQIQGALVGAARQLAIDTGLLEDQIPMTLTLGAFGVALVLPAGRAVQAVKRVEMLDEDGKWQELSGPSLGVLRGPDIGSYEASTPVLWASRNGEDVLFDCPTDAALPIRVTVSFIPAKDDHPEEIAFPSQAEKALVHGAKASLWEISGREQNLRNGAMEARAYRAELPRLCHLADVGNGRVRQSVNDALPME